MKVDQHRALRLKHAFLEVVFAGYVEAEQALRREREASAVSGG